MPKFVYTILLVLVSLLISLPVYALGYRVIRFRTDSVFDPYAVMFVVVLIFVLLQAVKIWAIWKVKQWEKEEQQQKQQKKAERDRLFAESRTRMRLKKQLTKQKSRKKKTPEK